MNSTIEMPASVQPRSVKRVNTASEIVFLAIPSSGWGTFAAFYIKCTVTL